MARPLRLYQPYRPYHVVQRGNNRQRVFFEPIDFIRYQDYLEDALLRYGVQCHAFVQMPNHVHLLLTPSCEDGVSRVMSLLGNRFVQNFNRRKYRTGTLWEGRHYASPVMSDRQFWAVQRYVEMNPVRAQLTRTAAQYYWSSYACNSGAAACNLVTPHPLYGTLGSTDKARFRAYRRLFMRPVDERELESIREAARRCLPLADKEPDK